MKLLTRSDRRLRNSGFTRLGAVNDELEYISSDQRFKNEKIIFGVYRYESELFYVNSKRYCFRGFVPFSEQHLSKALEDDAKLMIYFGDSNNHYMFAPEYVKRNGKSTVLNSKHRDSVSVMEVRKKHGIKLESWLSE